MALAERKKGTRVDEDFSTGSLNSIEVTSFGHPLSCSSLDEAYSLELDQIINSKADLLRYKREVDAWKAQMPTDAPNTKE